MGQHFDARFDVNLSAIPRPRTPSMPERRGWWSTGRRFRLT